MDIPREAIASRAGSVPELLWKSIATIDFPGGGGGGGSRPQVPPPYTFLHADNKSNKSCRMRTVWRTMHMLLYMDLVDGKAV